MSDPVDVPKSPRRPGGYQPPEPIQPAVLFGWPPKPLALIKWLFGFPGYLWPWNALFAGISLFTYTRLTPDLNEMGVFSLGWVARVFGWNTIIIVLFTSIWHFRLYVQKAQGTEYKYNSRWLSTNSPTFLFGSQIWDNVFWNVVSAVPIWTAWEVVTLWMQANKFVPLANWHTQPAYCILVTLLIPIYHEIHFYGIHRLIHWPPLYRTVHSLHHKNVNPGPWSGLAMHPGEHALYFSGVILFWLIPALSFHVVFICQYVALTAAFGHCGFHRIVLTRRLSVSADDYMHYLHHKYFEVNYGGGFVPIDKWLGTFHDGSDQAQEAMQRRVRVQRTAALASQHGQSSSE